MLKVDKSEVTRLENALWKCEIRGDVGDAGMWRRGDVETGNSGCFCLNK